MNHSVSQPASAEAGPSSSSVSPAGPASCGWLKAVLPVLLIAICAELGISILNNSTLPVYFTRGLHIETWKMGLIFACFFISESLVKSPLGALADKIGRRPLVLTGAAVTIFTPLLLLSMHYNPASATAVAVLVGFGFLRALDGIGEAALWPSLYAYIGDVVAENKRGAAMGLMNVAYLLAIAFSFLAGGFVDDSFGPWLTRQETFGQALGRMGARIHHAGQGLTQRLHHHPVAHAAATPPPVLPADLQPEYYFPSFYLTSLLFAVAVIAALALRSKAQVRQTDLAAAASEETISWTQLVQAIRTVPQYLGIALVTFIGIGCIAPIMKLFVIEQFGITETAFGVLVLPPALAIAAVAGPAGHLADRWGTALGVRLGFVLCALGLAGIPTLYFLHGGKFEFVAAATVMGVGFVVAFPAWLAMLTTLGGEEKRGTIFAAVSTAQGVGALLGVLLGTLLYSHVGRIAPFVAAASLVTLGALLVLLFVRPTGAAAPKEAP